MGQPIVQMPMPVRAVGSGSVLVVMQVFLFLTKVSTCPCDEGFWGGMREDSIASADNEVVYDGVSTILILGKFEGKLL